MPRKKSDIHYLYKTTCTVTGKYYIGMHSTNNLEDGYLGSGKKLRYSIRKYGKENHIKEILEFFDSRETLATKEREVVNLDLMKDEKCMNLKEGGEGGLGFHSLSACTKGGLISGKIHKEKLENNPEYRSKFVELWANKVKKAHDSGKIKYGSSGRILSDQSKKKISEKMKGKQDGHLNSQFGSCWIRNGEETKKVKVDELDSWLNQGWIQGRNYQRKKY